MEEYFRTIWVIFCSVLFGVSAQDSSLKKALKVAVFDCQLSMKDVQWLMDCESQDLMTESDSKYFIVKLRGNFDPVSPVIYNELLQSASFNESELMVCDSQWRYALITQQCERKNNLLTKLVRVLNETSFTSIEISRTLKVDYMLNILQDFHFLRHIILSNNSFCTIPIFPVYNNNSVISLLLERNGIINITDNVFSPFPSLQLLDLSHNLLKYVHKGMFGGLTTLSELDLSFNIIDAIPKDAFSPLLSIKKIVLRNNKLNLIDDDLFIYTNLIEDINISNNPLGSLPSTLFHKLPNLQNVSCSNCNLFSLERDLFRNSSSILRIDFSSNSLKYLHEDTFKDMFSLRSLDLGNNSIRNFSGRHFKNKQHLEYLNLTQNEIQFIKNDMFSGAPNILTLDLSKNKIKILTDNHLKSFTDLAYFNLRCNKLTYVELGLTTKPLYVRKLDISDNAITKINIGWKRLTYMEVFTADNNQLTSLDLPPCVPNEKLTLTFSFRYNNISKINTGALILDEERVKIDRGFSASCHFNGQEKNSVDLTHNPLFCDCNLYPFYVYVKDKSPQKLEKFLYIEKLTCAGPRHVNNHSLVSLSDDMFSCPLNQKCPELCYCGVRAKDAVAFVNCSSRNLQEVPENIPEGITAAYFNNNELKTMVSLNRRVWLNLSELHLDHNSLETLDGWNIPVSLHYLSLRGNKLKTLPSLLKEFIRNKSSFQLFFGHNDENCDCSRVMLKNFLIEIEQFVQDKEDILCKVKNNHNSTLLQLISVPDVDLCPLNSDALNYFQRKLIISLIVVFVLLLSLLLIYYRQRQLILSFLYIHCDELFRLCYTEEDCDEDHIFDAFIAYSSSDHDIMMKLMEELENKPPFFQLCIHERNWLPGLFITENIYNSVNRSRRTIIILSNSFIESPWFNLELRAAVVKMSEDKMSRIIVILSEKSVSLDSVDSELRHVISNRTYLVWGERWFWEKLRYAMPRKKRKKVVDKDNQPKRRVSELMLLPETY